MTKEGYYKNRLVADLESVWTRDALFKLTNKRRKNIKKNLSKCGGCKSYKPAPHFNITKEGKTYLFCRECTAARVVLFNADEHHIRLWRSAKSRAYHKDLPFDITPEDIKIPTHCPVLGIPLFAGQGKMGDNSPSLDRKIPERGYVKGNVWVISNRANRIKNDATAAELQRVAEAVLQATQS